MFLPDLVGISVPNTSGDRILSLVSVQGTNGGQNHEKLIQYFVIPECLKC